MPAQHTAEKLYGELSLARQDKQALNRAFDDIVQETAQALHADPFRSLCAGHLDREVSEPLSMKRRFKEGVAGALADGVEKVRALYLPGMFSKRVYVSFHFLGPKSNSI